MPLQSFADIEELEAHVIIEASPLLRLPFLTPHQKAEAARLLGYAAIQCAAFKRFLGPLIGQCVNEINRCRELLERQLLYDLDSEDESAEDDSSEDDGDDRAKRRMEEREAERVSLIARITNALEHANKLKSLRVATHATHLLIARYSMRLSKLPVQDSFPPPTYE